jgi:hypothetical protein
LWIKIELNEKLTFWLIRISVRRSSLMAEALVGSSLSSRGDYLLVHPALVQILNICIHPLQQGLVHSSLVQILNICIHPLEKGETSKTSRGYTSCILISRCTLFSRLNTHFIRGNTLLHTRPPAISVDTLFNSSGIRGDS